MLFKNTNTHRGNFGLQQTPSLTTHLKANNGVANNIIPTTIKITSPVK